MRYILPLRPRSPLCAPGGPASRNSRTLPVSLVLCLALVVCLAGCGGKQISVDEADTLNASLASSQTRPTIYLPADDGKPLTEAEKRALVSVGDFDRNVSGEDMRDVLLHFKHYVHQGRRTVEKNVERGEVYLPHIRQVLRRKNLPLELAYLPFIESGYDIRARSRTGALGMWQFVKGTGKYYGMKRDWWSDERHCPYQSTDAATEYLGKLNTRFKDWHLAITSYNAGEGRVSRAAEAAGTKNFFELRRRNHLVPEKDKLTDENQQYLPRFLAVCKIMRNLDSLGFRQPDPRRALQAAEVSVKPGTDLMAFSKALGMNWSDFSDLNPAFLRYISPPDRGMSVYVPAGLEARARKFASKAGGGSGWSTYTVQKGDTFKRISSRTGVPVQELRRVNRVGEPLKAGAKLRIPRSVGKATASSGSSSLSGTKTASSAKAPASGSYSVKAGDTVYGLSRSWGVTPQAIRSANNLKNDTLSIGQRLSVPGKAATKAAVATASKTSSSTVKAAGASAKVKTRTYTVKAGDTIWGIARKFNMPPGDLLKINNMDRNATIKPGDTVRVVGK